MGDMLNTVESHEELEYFDDEVDSIIEEVNSEDENAETTSEFQEEMFDEENITVEKLMPTKEELHEIMMNRVKAKAKETNDIILEANKNNRPQKSKAEELREMMERKIEASKNATQQVMTTTIDKNEIATQIRQKISERARERLRSRYRDSYTERQKERARERYREGMRKKVREKVESVAISLLKEKINPAIIAKSTGLTIPEVNEIKRDNNL